MKTPMSSDTKLMKDEEYESVDSTHVIEHDRSAFCFFLDLNSSSRSIPLRDNLTTSFEATQENGTSVTKMSVHVTAEEKTNKKNDSEGRSETLLLIMALPNEHQLTFSQYSDAKTMFAAIEINILERLAILGVVITQEDLNSKLSEEAVPPPEWNEHNGSALHPVEEHMGTRVGAGVLRTNDVNTANPAYEVSTVSSNINIACPQVSTANFSDNIVYAFMVENPNGSNLLQRDLEQIHEDDMEAMDLKWQLSLLSMRAKRWDTLPGNVEHQGTKRGQHQYQDNTKEGKETMTATHPQRAMLAINASKNLDKLLGSQITDKSKKSLGYNVVPLPYPLIYNRLKKLDFSYSGLNEFKDPEFKSYGSEDSKQESNIICDKKSYASKENSDDSLIEFVKPKNHEKPVKKSVRYAEMYRSQSPRGNQRNWNGQKLIVNTIKGKGWTVNTAHPKSIVFSAKPMSHFSKSAQSTVRRPYQSKTVLSNKRFTQTNNTAKAKAVNTARPKAVNTALSHISSRICVSVNQGKPQQDDTGFIDSGCLRYMTGNIAYLSDFKEFDRGYVTFGGMCDKKNYVRFTDTECLVLSPNFKLRDESQTLLKIPRKDNMYSFDMKNIVPKESLTCLVAKDTSDGIGDLGSNTELLREYRVARTPQQNGIAERRNKTLIEVARTMLVDSKLPTTFWAEVVSKFDGKSDEGFFVGYSLSSKDFRVYNTRTRRVEENLHIGFLENKPMIEGNGPKWLFDIDSLTQSMIYVPVAAGTISNESTDASYFDSPFKDVGNGEPKSIVDDQKQVEDGPDNKNNEKDKSEDDSSPKEVNAAGKHVNTISPEVNIGSFKLNTVDTSVNTASSYDPDSPNDMFKMGANHTFEATHVEFFSDEDEPEADLGNITNSYTVPPTPKTRIHKDHPIINAIGDVKSSIQTRRMTKSTSEKGFLSVVYEQKTHDTMNTCLYACFLS
ncbi:putative ribonuclease H-like domain-containing protein [Tanacetum coccineum]|uniref:Ribonuclease H-like domain-containing protein n=1 Tax=Tanacetum coccineum TaxID=301880 RepID=A0ABQ5GEZ7_9ASTR